jgi:hypothetical protein
MLISKVKQQASSPKTSAHPHAGTPPLGQAANDDSQEHPS